MHDDCQAGGKVPCRGAVSVPRKGRPPAGLAVRGGSPGPLRLWWQQEAIPVHLLPLGWPGWRAVAVTAGAGLLSVPPWGGGGFSLEAGPKGPGCPCRAPLPQLCLAAWPSGHSLQSPVPLKQLCVKPIWVMGGGAGRLWKPSFLPKLLFWQVMSWKDNSASELEGGAELASIP